MKINHKYLITTDDWFFAPDGENYRAVFGTFHAVVDSEAVLGIKANRNSTNWYAVIGDTILAGCRIHYTIRANEFNSEPVQTAEIDHEGVRMVSKNATSRIYNADESGLVALIESN